MQLESGASTLGRHYGYLHERLIELEKSEVDSEAKIPSDDSQRYASKGLRSVRRSMPIS